MMLNNSVKATTVVSIVDQMEVSVTTFTSSFGGTNSVPGSSLQPTGILGSVTLSPVQSKATNVAFQVGSQKLNIELISFRAQYGLDTGQVSCNGTLTDRDGKSEVPFAKVIAAWS